MLLKWQLKEKSILTGHWPTSTTHRKLFPSSKTETSADANFWMGEYVCWLKRQPSLGMHFSKIINYI